MSQTASLTTSRLAFQPIYPLFVDRFGRSLKNCRLGFDKEAISDGCRSENARYVWGGGVCILSEFREFLYKVV